MPNSVHRALSTLFALAAFAVLLYEAKGIALLPAMIAAATALLWLSESKWIVAGKDELLRPVANALWLALLVVCSIGFTSLARDIGVRLSVAAIALSLVWIAYVAYLMMNASQLSNVLKAIVVIAAVLFAIVSVSAPGLIACALALVMAFTRGSRVATALALIGFVAYLFGYYYQTDNSLLDKAKTLAITAILLWTAAFALRALRERNIV
jgi:uncharacterized membrane protein